MSLNRAHARIRTTRPRSTFNPWPPAAPRSCDVFFAGHWHYYQRYLPYNPVTKQVGTASADNHTYLDPTLMTMIVSGAPGDVERNDACPGDASVAAFTPSCTPAYGYGIFTAFNATHFLWSFEAQQTPIGAARHPGNAAPPVTFRDHVWIVRSAPPA